MKSAWEIVPESPEESFVRKFDLREIDARPPTFWTSVWWGRIGFLLGQVAQSVPPGGAVLDVGCAQGTLAILLAERAYRVVGVDLRPGFIRYAQKKDDRGVCTWVVGNAMELPFAPGTFDLVILGEIIEHVAEPQILIKHALTFVKQGGTLVATTPNGASFHNSSLPPYKQAAQDLDGLRRRQFGPAGESHLFAVRPEELPAMVPAGLPFHVRYAVSAFWNRLLSPLARSRRLSRAIDSLSNGGPWRRYLCDDLILIVRKRPSA